MLDAGVRLLIKLKVFSALEHFGFGIPARDDRLCCFRALGRLDGERSLLAYRWFAVLRDCLTLLGNRKLSE